MKTFEEARAIVIPVIEIGTNHAKVEESVLDFSERYSELAAQAIKDQFVQRAIWALVQEVANDRCSPMTSMFTMFMTGLAIGIEMEKSEVPLPDAG